MLPFFVSANQALTGIVAETDSHRFADRLSTLLRERLELQSGQQLTRQTTAEIAMQSPDSPLVPILARCDAVRFAGESLTDEDWAGLLAAARQLLEPAK